MFFIILISIHCSRFICYPPNVPRALQDGGKGAAVQYRHVHLPRAIDRFVTKDSHHKVTHTHPAEVRIVAVML